MSLQELRNLTDVLLTKDEEIVRAKREWEATFDSVPDLIIIFNNDLIITNVNKSFCNDVGIKKEEIIGKHYQDLFYNECSDTNDNCFRYISNLTGWYQIAVSKLYDHDNNVIGSVHILHDITKIKEAELELIKKNEEMEEMSRDLADRIRRIEKFLCEFRAKYENTIKYMVEE
ncbi:MAG: PAS domain S-box protein [Patescibacteria group bacterium]|jgi:PAS domain-containing protein